MATACEPSSSLPPGLLARDFQTTLGTVLAGGVLLDKLPPDLHEIWPRGLTLLFRGVNPTEIPDVMLRMDRVRISLLYNRVNSLPAAIFKIPTLKWLDMSSTPLTELPEHAEPSPSLLQVSMVGTSVASLPK